jgi:GNAT superfamily N-acetyltransferase
VTRFSIREVDATEEHYAEDLITLHDYTFCDANIRPNLERGWWWLVYGMDWGSPKEPIAFCGLTPTYSTPGTSYLKRAGVLHAFRGRGLQRRMIAVREKRARREGFTTMITDTTDNPASANSLIRAGYKIFEPADRWAFPRSIYWRKALI